MSMSNEAYIETLKAQLKTVAFEAGVCDMLGWRDTDECNSPFTITEAKPPHIRYEIRSRQHIEVYGFTTLATNY